MLIEDTLCEKLNIKKHELRQFCLYATKKYKVYSIPKRTGGNRLIAQPTHELKKYQRIIISILMNALPIHSSAYAYREGLSIKDNALQHVNSSYLLKMDFQNFFNKIKPSLFFSALRIHNLTFSSADLSILESLLFWKPGVKRSKTLVLSVGAPSSPLITNFVMYSFDVQITKWCKDKGITYTRYADDISFSTNIKDVLFLVPNIVKKMLRETIPGMTVNESKTVFSSKAHNRHITGVTLSTDNNISLGRKKKKFISSLIFKFREGVLPAEEAQYLRGLLSHASNIEPLFIARMKKKYGEPTIEMIKKGAS